MKHINLYLKENSVDGKNGHWEEYYDEDTGELTSLWVDDKPEQIIKAIKEATPEQLQKLKDLRKAYDKAGDTWYSEKEDLRYLEEEIHNRKDDIRDLQYGMEDEIGGAETDEEKENLGNKYGEELDRVETNLRKLVKQLESKKKKVETLKKKMDKAQTVLYDYEDKIGYHITNTGKIHKIHNF